MSRFTQTVLLALFACIALTARVGFAQSARSQFSPTRDGAPANRSVELLFQEADGYVNGKREEFKKQNVTFDDKLASKISQEQKQLAAKYVDELQARGPLAGDDLYYFGRLQHLAGNEDSALESLRLFLAMTPEGEKAQLARPVAVRCAISKQFISEAEQIAADYAHNQPQQLSQRFEMENLLTGAFRGAADFEAMAKHARAMLKMVKRGLADKNCGGPLCDQMLLQAASLVAEAYAKQHREDDAVEMIEGVRKIAISRPSAYLYMLATQRLFQLDPAADQQRIFAAAEPPERVPELKGTEWVDQSPAKLAELRGRVVLLDFWATWCGPCRQTFPDLRKWHTSYKDKGLVIIGVTKFFGDVEGRKVTRDEELAYLRDFKKKNELPYAFVVGDSDADTSNYGVFAIPTYFLIDRRGNLRSIGMGAGGPGATALEKTIKKLIDEPVTGTAAAAPESGDMARKSP
jgi:thiol-disulfide isomerase/thioredoxin